MIYASSMPRVVGSFDAEGLHDRVDQIVDANPNARSYDVQMQLGNGRYRMMEDLVDIRYGRFFMPGAFESRTVDGQINELDYYDASYEEASEVDKWHCDSNISAKFFVLPEILTAASRWPTEFLVGKIGVKPCLALHPHWDPNHKWMSEEGRVAIERAIDKGDARIYRFEPGEMLHVPAGTLHRRAIPEGESGFRYFIRHFPRFSWPRSCTTVGRLRPL